MWCVGDEVYETTTGTSVGRVVRVFAKTWGADNGTVHSVETSLRIQVCIGVRRKKRLEHVGYVIVRTGGVWTDARNRTLRFKRGWEARVSRDD